MKDPMVENFEDGQSFFFAFFVLQIFYLWTEGRR